MSRMGLRRLNPAMVGLVVALVVCLQFTAALDLCKYTYSCVFFIVPARGL